MFDNNPSPLLEMPGEILLNLARQMPANVLKTFTQAMLINKRETDYLWLDKIRIDFPHRLAEYYPRISDEITSKSAHFIRGYFQLCEEEYEGLDDRQRQLFEKAKQGIAFVAEDKLTLSDVLLHDKRGYNLIDWARHGGHKYLLQQFYALAEQAERDENGFDICLWTLTHWKVVLHQQLDDSDHQKLNTVTTEADATKKIPYSMEGIRCNEYNRYVSLSQCRPLSLAFRFGNTALIKSKNNDDLMPAESNITYRNNRYSANNESLKSMIKYNHLDVVEACLQKGIIPTESMSSSEKLSEVYISRLALILRTCVVYDHAALALMILDNMPAVYTLKIRHFQGEIFDKYLHWDAPSLVQGELSDTHSALLAYSLVHCALDIYFSLSQRQGYSRETILNDVDILDSFIARAAVLRNLPAIRKLTRAFLEETKQALIKRIKNPVSYFYKLDQKRHKARGLNKQFMDALINFFDIDYATLANSKDEDGVPFVFEVLESPHDLSALQTLLEHGDLSILDSNGNSVAYYLVQSDFLMKDNPNEHKQSVLKILTEFKQQIFEASKKDNGKYHPWTIMVCRIGGSVRLFKQVEPFIYASESTLTYAAHHEVKYISRRCKVSKQVKKAISLGLCNPNALDDNNETALDIAERIGHYMYKTGLLEILKQEQKKKALIDEAKRNFQTSQTTSSTGATATSTAATVAAAVGIFSESNKRKRGEVGDDDIDETPAKRHCIDSPLADLDSNKAETSGARADSNDDEMISKKRL